MPGNVGSLGSLGRCALTATLLCACAAPRAAANVASAPDPDREPPDVRLLLIGDAGGDEHNPVLTAFGSEIARDPLHSAVLVLGDNVYPNGLTDTGTASRAPGERRFRAILDAVRGAAAGAIILPGNHDWGTEDGRGVEVLSREAELVNRDGGGAIRMLPLAGCPGPSVVDIGVSLRIVVLDTEWWLRTPDVRGASPASCLTTQTAVLDSLRQAIATAGTRRVIVAAHHPLASGGSHGGRFGWQQHLFPLREIWSPLWLPLPVVGSLYPLLRRLRNLPEDLSSPSYRHLRASIEGVLRERPPFAYASGHEHNLQVLNGTSAPLLLVSGGGSRDRPSFVSRSKETLFAQRANGFMRLDVWKEGEAQLTVVTVDRRGTVCECFQLRVK